jgi:hypothetical protein
MSLELIFFRGSGLSNTLCLDISETRNLSKDSCFCFIIFLGLGVKSGNGPANKESNRVLLMPYFCKTLSYIKYNYPINNFNNMSNVNRSVI